MRSLVFIALLLPGLVQAANTLPASLVGQVEADSQVWRTGQNSQHYVIQLVSVRDTKNFPSLKEINDIKEVDPLLDVIHLERPWLIHDLKNLRHGLRKDH